MSRRVIERAGAAAVALVLLLVVVRALSGGGGTRSLTAFFPRATGLYADSSVRVLGVSIGKITKIVPEGQRVRVEMRYDDHYKLPRDAVASLVPPSIVSDRYIQISPVWQGGPRLPDRAVIPEDRTQVPVELDDIFGQIDELSRALGPEGANRSGALSKLVDVGAANLRGNGEQLNTTLRGFSQAVQTLSNSRKDLFGTVSALQQFTTALARDDGGVRKVNADLAAVSVQLAGERRELGLALANLAVALRQVADFVRENRSALTDDLRGLTATTGTILKEQRALEEVLDVAPTGLQNLALSYDPQTRTLRTRSSQQQGSGLNDPLNPICQILTGLKQRCPSSSSLPLPPPPALPKARGAVAPTGVDPVPAAGSSVGAGTTGTGVLSSVLDAGVAR